LCEEERVSVCCALNHEKLSPEALKDLCRNSKFPSETVERALITQQSKIKRSLHENLSKEKDAEQILLCNKKLHLSSDNEKLRAADLQGMNWKVMELEKVRGTMQTHMMSIMRSSRLPILSNARSLPKLCS
jgi:hypothetical protein